MAPFFDSKRKVVAKMFLAPMLLEKREKPFDDDRYLFEPKIDGHRLILSM